jgi:hypothetical protein
VAPWRHFSGERISGDGLPLGRSAALDRDSAEHLAAMASALSSLSRGVGEHFAKGLLQQTVVELEYGFLVVTEAGAGACLALLASAHAVSHGIVCPPLAMTDGWSVEDDPGPLVRPFAVTRGRAGRDLHKLDILTLVMAARSEADVAALDREYREIVRLCQRRALSVAEIAAHMDLLLVAVKVLVSDLIESGHLICRSPRPTAGRPDIKLLQAVLDGVRKL